VKLYGLVRKDFGWIRTKFVWVRTEFGLRGRLAVLGRCLAGLGLSLTLLGQS